MRIAQLIRQANITREQYLILGMKRVEIVKIKAKENQKQSPGRGKKGSPISEKPLETIDTTQELADFAGVGLGPGEKLRPEMGVLLKTDVTSAFHRRANQY